MNIVVVNACRIVANAEVEAYVGVLQAFDSEVLAPAWNLEPCVYSFLPTGQMPKRGKDIWPIFLNNKSNIPSALGWHDDKTGLIFSRVFVGDCKRLHLDWRVDLSHEAFEMRVDPTINRMETLADGRIAAIEVCDAVEDELYAIRYRGSIVSDFCLPSYYGLGAQAGPFDYGGHLNGACPAILSGGYQSLFVAGKWQTIVNRMADGRLPYRALRNGRNFRRAGGKR